MSAQRLSTILAAPAMRRAFALLLSGALAVAGVTSSLVRLIRSPSTGGVNRIAAWADVAYAPLRPRLGAGERVGVLVQSGDPRVDVALHFAAQYALAPAIVVPIFVDACGQAAGGKRCEVDSVARIAFAPGDPATVRAAVERLHLVPVERVGGVIVFGRAP